MFKQLKRYVKSREMYIYIYIKQPENDEMKDQIKTC